MTSRFLQSYKFRSSKHGNIKDLELVHPINKSIKASQIYQDSVSPTSDNHHIRVASQSPKINSSLILEPLHRVPKLSNSICYDSYQEDRFSYIENGKNHSSHFDKKPSKQDDAVDYRMRSQIHKIRPPKRIIL